MQPLISLVVPVYNTKSIWLRECLDSVLNQTFNNWELCICNNASNFETSEILNEYYVRNPDHIKLCTLSTNEGGAKGINEALKCVAGQYVGLLDSDDILPTESLNVIAKHLIDYKPDVSYTDELIINTEKNPIIPFYKPNFNRELLCFLHYFGHLTVYRTALIKRLRLRQYGGSYDYDLALRASEFTSEIYHIPSILYWYRTYPESTSTTTKESCIEGGLQTLQEHLDLMYKGATALRGDPFYKVKLQTGEFLKSNLNIEDFTKLPSNLIGSLFNEFFN